MSPRSTLVANLCRGEQIAELGKVRLFAESRTNRQGHLFGEPRAIKDSVLSEAGAPPSTVVQMPQRRAAVG